MLESKLWYISMKTISEKTLRYQSGYITLPSMCCILGVKVEPKLKGL